MVSEIAQKPFDKSWIQPPNINKFAVKELSKKVSYVGKIDDLENRALWLLKAISLIDLTTLSGDDTRCNVRRLCYKAAGPLSEVIYKKFQVDSPITTAAVCVYPSRVSDARESLQGLNLPQTLPIAAVATGFPSGLYSIESRLMEIEYAIKCGATEIDIVIDRGLVISGKWALLYEELCKMRNACKDVHMKAILGVGELETLDDIYMASMIAMHAGSDFIKTSTGKETSNATIPVGIVMCRAIRDFHRETGIKVGLKPAGGIKTWKDALNWMVLIKEQLGDDWLNPSLFRIGASSLLGDIEQWLYEYVTEETLMPNSFSFI